MKSPYTLEEAKNVVAGYAFHREALKWKLLKPTERFVLAQDSRLRDAADSRRYAWGYVAFDCQPSSPGERLTLIDLLVTQGLNARLRQEEVSAFLTVSDDVSAALSKVPTASQFWKLEIESFPAGSDDPGPPSADSGDGQVAWWMCRAWYLLARTPGFDVARAHKILHHKRPHQFPLLDQRTAGHMKSKGTANRSLWDLVLKDLRSYVHEFEKLERWFSLASSAMQAERPGVTFRAITRLRLHDILIWCDATSGARELAARSGEALLRELGT